MSAVNRGTENKLLDRDYQTDVKNRIYAAWAEGQRGVMPVCPTGSGKTHIFTGMHADFDGRSYVTAHRRELVRQISLALTRQGCKHGIIAPKPVIKEILRAQIDEVGRNCYQPNAKCTLASVDTLIARKSDVEREAGVVGMYTQDEGHHALAGNKWGRAAALFPHAYMMLPTATPWRADGKGLGVHADGIADTIVLGPTVGTLIQRGYLSGYRIYAPPSDVDLSHVEVSSSTGDYKAPQLKKANAASHIVGDVVACYQKFASGKRGITFTVDVEEAVNIAAAFNAAGVAAAAVSAKSSDTERAHAMARFERGELLQLVNCDLFGEGLDVPGVECVSFARATASLSLYLQQFGRVLRPAEGKPHAVVIDHVGNVLRHGLPDSPRVWTLDRRETRGGDTSNVKLKICQNVECVFPYEAFYKACPLCGHAPEPAARSAPQYVDGDLFELDAETLAKMRGEQTRIDADPIGLYDGLARAAGRPAAMAAERRHRERQDTQAHLRAWIAQWAGEARAAGFDDAHIYRKFYHTFGVDILSAQSLGKPEALALTEKVRSNLNAAAS